MTKILCVDDCSDILRLWKEMLGSQGFHVVACESPGEGLTRLRKQHFDAVVSDYEMPEMNGLSFARQARANGYRRPIILCTASTLMEGKIPAGIDAVVIKGSNPLLLGSTVNRCLARIAA